MKEPCPSCDGTGMIEIMKIKTVAECCGNFDQYGGCCDNPNPIPVQEPDIDQCPDCYGTGEKLKENKI